MNKIAREYINKGLTAPLPLPEGAKFPPPVGTTGNIPNLKFSEIEDLWKSAPGNANVGLRLQCEGKFEIISLDVDHYGSKQGRDFLSEMEQELGELNLDSVPRSTRRGIESESAQFFFRVPRGIKWKSSACSDVDIVQMTHRYAAVYPSVVDGKQYRWYVGNEAAEIPHVSDIPVLPERWVNFLKKSSVGKLSRSRKSNFTGQESDQHREAVEWLRLNIPGWDTSENMSQSLAKVSKSDQFLASLEGNGHDSMVSAVHAAVMLGVEGHLGLKAALYQIKHSFVNAVTLREESPRTQSQAEAEYNSAVVGEVERLISEIEEGSVHIAEYGADLALPGFSDLLVRSEAEKRPKDVDLSDYSNTDLGHAEMLRDYWGKDLLTVFGGDSSQEFANWVAKSGRYDFRDKKRTFSFLEPAISARIEFEAQKLLATAEDLESISDSRQLNEDELDPDELRAAAGKLFQRADRCRNTNSGKAILEQMHGFDESSINIDQFDSSQEIVGLQGGETLDLLSLRVGDEFVRKSRQVDMLTKSTAVRLVPNAESDHWDDFLRDFLPDEELRSFVQKVIGYSLLAGNPEKKIIFLFGPSNTGKTTILEAVAAALGDYAGPMDAIKLFGHSSGGPSPEMVSSLNRRMVFMSEVGDDHRLSANAVKRVTGNDTQAVRQLHSNVMRNAAPKFTPYISTNSVPDIRGVDAATRERIMVIPFENAHPRKPVTEESNLKNPNNLTAILWWVVEGLQRYFDEGLDPKKWPERVRKASGAFATNTSPIQSFLEVHLERSEDRTDRIPVFDLFQHWENHCLNERIDKRDIGSVEDFRKRLVGNDWVVERGTVNGKKNQYFVRFAKLA